MIRQASWACDEVRVFVSLSDRRRSGDAVPILGSDMAVIWRDIIRPSLPGNVVIVYGGNPISNVWRTLGQARAGEGNAYVIYADAQDLAINFHDGLLEHYCGELFRTGLVEKFETERRGSGTRMRQLLASGARDEFLAELPPHIDGGTVWDILSSTARNAPRVKATSQPKKGPSPVPKARKAA